MRWMGWDACFSLFPARHFDFFNNFDFDFDFDFDFFVFFAFLNFFALS